MAGKVSRGDVVEVSLDPTLGAEIKKERPCVVVQNDVGNRVYPLTIVVPGTAQNINNTCFLFTLLYRKAKAACRKTASYFAIRFVR